MIAPVSTKTFTEAEAKLVRDDNHVALARMLIFVTGKTHEMLAEMAGKLRRAITSAADSDGTLDSQGLLTARRAVDREWDDFFPKWRVMFDALRREAASIPFGMLAAMHEEWAVESLATIEEATLLDIFFDDHVDEIVRAAERRAGPDGLRLSNRIWNLDNHSRAELVRRLYAGAAQGEPAYNIAGDLEQYLGVAQGCPRWTRTRLRLTKAEIAAGNRAGLFSGEECAGQGVAYNALRLARNELQVLHAMATDAVMAKMPWIEKEQIALSPNHPVTDACDDIAGGGENGEGIYEKGSIQLPIHVHCLCFKLAVLMDRDEFIDKLRSWVNDRSTWPAMTEYEDFIGAALKTSLLSLVIAGVLTLWLSGTWDSMESQVE